MKKSLPDKPEVSIVVVNYNTGEHLAKCILAIKETTANFSKPFSEVIVVDNASSDESILSLSRINTGKRVSILGNSENLGFAKATNLGIKQADGPYILLLNPDTEVKEGAIETLLSYAKEVDDAGAVVPKLLDPNGTTQASVIHLPTIGRAIKEFWFGEKVYSKYVPRQDGPIEVEAAVMAAFLITPTALDKVGVLDEKYFMYFEDLDYCRRLKLAGLKVFYNPKAQVEHQHGLSGRNITNFGDQWRRLIPSSKIYNGEVKHKIINFVIWSGQKWRKLFGKE